MSNELKRKYLTMSHLSLPRLGAWVTASATALFTLNTFRLRLFVVLLVTTIAIFGFNRVIAQYLLGADLQQRAQT